MYLGPSRSAMSSLSNCAPHHWAGRPCEVYRSSGGRGKGRIRMRSFMAKRKRKHPSAASKKSRSLCRSLCCNSRLSVSSSSSDGAGCGGVGGKSSDDSEQLESLSNLAHGMVQARLESMINQWEPRADTRPRRSLFAGERSGGGGVFLVAMDKRSYDPKGDFKKSIQEVIASKGMEEPKELRGLLNCYLSMNSSEHRQVILEAFHEACSAIFCHTRCRR